MALHKLNKESTKIFEYIISQPKNVEGEYWKFDAHNYNPDDGGFMPLVVEQLYNTTLLGRPVTAYSFAHYWIQNGDSMRDPEMCFYYDAELHAVYPYYFRQDPYFEEYSILNNSDGMKYSPGMMKGQKDFANMWMRNINEQQRLGVKI